MNNYNIGIDIGGTNITIGIIDNLGNIKVEGKLPTNPKIGSNLIIQAIIVRVDELLNKSSISLHQIDSIGVGVPGTVDSEKGVVIFAPNIFWTDVDIRTPLANHYKKPVYAAQDTRAGAWGEYLLGQGRGKNDIACVTLGTGVGAGIIISGKIFNGGFNTAGEFGHQIVEYGGNKCNCGRWGCLETYAGGLSIVNQARNLYANDSQIDAEKISVADVYKMAYEGSYKALTITNNVVKYVGLGMVNLINIFSPDLITISGGISNAPDNLLLQPLNKFISENAYISVANTIKVTKSKLGDNAPMVGASLLYKQYN